MKENEWIYINTEEDIKILMELFGYFHDGCIKEIKYISGMYVTKNLSMQPLNDKREVSVIFQRQWKNPTAIEMLFTKIDCLYLRPKQEDYDGIIFGAYMCFEDDKIIWFDADDFNKEFGYKEMYDYPYISWIKAANVKYRIIKDY